MAKLPTSLKVMNEDIAGAPSWAGKITQIYNTFNQAIYEALNGRLTLTENIACQIKEMTFRTESDYTGGSWVDIVFSCPLAKPIWVQMAQIYRSDNPLLVLGDPISMEWVFINGNIIIKNITGLENERLYFTRFIVF